MHIVDMESLAVTPNGVLRAGMAYDGLYRYDDGVWEQMEDNQDLKFLTIRDMTITCEGYFWLQR